MATYYVDMDVGADVNLGTSEGAGNAWKTIDKAMNTVAAADKVWVKASANYTELATIDTVGTKYAPIVFEGYTSATGDGGRATITGSGARASCIADSKGAGTDIYYVFKNFRMTDATGDGFSSDCDLITFKNCKFDANGADGVAAGSITCEACEFTGNTANGAHLAGPGGAIFVGCTFYSNVQGINTGGNIDLVVVGCIFFSNSGHAINSLPGDQRTRAIINCTFDGDNKDTTTGVRLGNDIPGLLAIVNTVLYDCATGIELIHGNQGESIVSRNNAVNSNTANYSNAETFAGEVTAAPDFVDEVAGADYTPSASSPLLEAGFDAGSTSYMDIGGIQRDAPPAADYPAQADVEAGVSYDSGGQTGTFDVPAVGDVQSGVNYGNSSEFTGTFTEPGVANVESGVQYGAGGTEFTGTFGVPAVGDVQDSVQYGGGGTEFTGTFTEPGVGNVHDDTSYGSGGTEFTGTFAEPGVANVASGTTYGSGGVEFTGTLVSAGGSGLATKGNLVG